jgi:hypothetical protein
MPMSNQKFNRYSIALNDFQKASSYALKAGSYGMETLEYDALVFAAVVSFYRPFSQNERTMPAGAATKLKIEDFPPLSEEELVFHDQIKTLRNKVFAHAEFDLHPTGINEITKVISSNPFPATLVPPEVVALAKLANKFIDFCHKIRGDFSGSLSR